MDEDNRTFVLVTEEEKGLDSYITWPHEVDARDEIGSHVQCAESSRIVKVDMGSETAAWLLALSQSEVGQQEINRWEDVIQRIVVAMATSRF